ncbi:CDP-alcohol phosphatidyltransferase family protein [Arcanobacterium bovis]|uniref:Phosphatidylcholine synthase n=1 Tax=Arcanobacterium bovis TaxID=2529275 RepID=A0A4Q9V1Q1_9ACTO|nr:CDP-alcohol phosphatidyltransferase family protein [Arcanobacterium bovis]TBW22040.1 phosphatidylcholine synthase [Arcanobacterium bovis]
MPSQAPHTISQRIAAWGVHAFTLSGLMFACLATLSLIDREITWMWLWLGIAMIIDAIDGTFARKARVQEVITWFDGGIVDIAIDYLTWTFIPAVFMYLFLPLGPKPLAMALMILIVVSSMFCYANKQWKSSDYYFVGFPAAWNIVAVILYILQTGWAFNASVTIVLAILTLVPTHYTHPFRVKKLMPYNIAAISIWIASVAALVAMYPKAPTWLLALFWISGGWFMLTGMLRTIFGQDPQEN